MRWNVSKYFNSDYWTHFFRHLPSALKGCSTKVMRVGEAVAIGFSKDDCSTQASALTFYSLLSIVPVLAVAFGIAKGFGFESILQNELKQKFSEQPVLIDQLVQFAYNTLENTQGGWIAGIGLVLLFWTVIKLLSNIESAFNLIWKIRKPRSLARRFSDYLAMILFCPVFFGTSSSISVFVITKLTHMSQSDGIWKTVTPFAFFVLHLFPLVLAWFLFTAIYYIMPNTKVPFKYALISGIIAGTAYLVVQWIYIKFQIGLTSYGAIYGSFAALPLFFIWLNTSWLIALIGAEIAYHTEDDMTLSSPTDTSLQRSTEARICGLMLMRHCIQAFSHGLVPPSIYILMERTGINLRAARQLIAELIDAGLLVEVNWRGSSGGHYQPGRDLKHITVKAVCDALDSSRQHRYVITYGSDVEQYEKILASFDTLVEQIPSNLPLDREFNL